MTLRRFATSECMEPSRDLDKYGQYLFSGNLTLVQIDFQRRVASYANKSPEEAKKAAADDLYAMHWGPTRVTLYNLLLLAIVIDPMGREGILQVTRWLANEAQVPVNGRDVSGTTAMHHAISTKPSFDPEFAQILYDAGGDVMIRNRYGETAVFEAVKIMDFIRAKGKPISGLGSLAESESENPTALEKPEYPSSSFTFDKPPSRDGRESTWKDPNKPEFDSQKMSHLRKYQEKEYREELKHETDEQRRTSQEVPGEKS